MIKSLKEKYNLIPQTIKATFFYTIIVFFQSAVNLLTTPIFTRILSTTDYGITNLYNSWYGILSIFMTLNLYSGVYNNAMLEFKEKRNEVTSSFLAISVSISLIALIIFVVFKNYISNFLGLSSILVFWIIINCISLPAWNFFINKEKFEFRYIKPFIISCIIFISNPILGIIGIKLFPDHMAEAKVIFSGTLNVILGLILLIIIFKNGKKFYDKKLWKYALDFNIPLIPHYLANVLLASSDRIMIAKYINEATAGIYSVSYNISNVINGVLTGINSIWIPYTYKNFEKKEFEKIKNNTTYLVIIVAVISLIVILIAPEAIKILAPEEYFVAIWVIPPIIYGVYLNFISSLFSNIEFIYKKSYFVAIATTIAGIANILLNIIFIPKFGFIAAGYTTLIGYLLLACMHYIFMKKIEKTFKYDIKKILIISFYLGITTSIATLLYKSIIIRYSLIVIICILPLIKIKEITNFIKKIK